MCTRNESNCNAEQTKQSYILINHSVKCMVWEECLWNCRYASGENITKPAALPSVAETGKKYHVSNLEREQFVRI